MTKTDLIDALHNKIGAGIAKKDINLLLDYFVDVVSGALAKGESVEIRGFGSFVRRERAKRTARNPKTGKPVQVKARKVPAFRPSKALRDKVDKK
jgi:DNA-binding protein HU-beta